MRTRIDRQSALVPMRYSLLAYRDLQERVACEKVKEAAPHFPTCRILLAPHGSIAFHPSRGYNGRMNAELKITKIGNSAGVVLPKDLLAHLDVTIGESVMVTKTSNGIELHAPSSDFDAQMTAAREVMARRKRALRELAK